MRLDSGMCSMQNIFIEFHFIADLQSMMHMGVKILCRIINKTIR